MSLLLFLALEPPADQTRAPARSAARPAQRPDRDTPPLQRLDPAPGAHRGHLLLFRFFAEAENEEPAGSGGILRGRLGIRSKLFGLLQLVGDTMIDVIGPMRVIRGDTLSLRLTVTDDEDDREDLTDAEIELQVRTAAGAAGGPLIRKVVGDGIEILEQDGDTIGQADIEISSVDTDRAPALLWLDVVVTLVDRRQHVIAPRKFSIVGSVTPVS